MQRTDVNRDIERLLTEVNYATVASVCPDGRPWNTPVRCHFDEALNMYWVSWPENQHSCNIAGNPAVFVVIYDSQAKEGEAVGLYLEMTARMLSGEAEIAQARTIYTTHFGEDMSHTPFTGTCPRRLYKATPIRVWQNDAGYIKGNFVDIRVPLSRY